MLQMSYFRECEGECSEKSLKNQIKFDLIIIFIYNYINTVQYVQY